MKIVLTYSIITSFFITSCNGQDEKKENKQTKFSQMDSLKNAPYNISDEGDGIKFNYDTLSPKYITLATKSLKDKTFKFPDNTNFENTIKEVFEFDIAQYKNKIVVIKPSKFPNIAVKEYNFILLEDPEYDDTEGINSDLLFFYNNYLFNNDRDSYNYLKLNQPILLKDLVISFGYNKDKELVRFAFEKFDFNNEISFHDLIFSYNVEYQKYYIRKGIIDDIENLIFGGATEDFSYAKEGNAYNRIRNIINKINENKNKYFQPDETIAFLYEKELQIGVIGDLEETFDKNRYYKNFLEKNNFYGFERLREYVKIIYQPSDGLDKKNKSITIYDTDGYTNLRKEKNSRSEILQKINSGEHIEVLDNSEDWFLVRTKAGKEGYVHKSRIKS